MQEDRTLAEAGLLVLHARAGLDEQIDGRAVGGVGVARVAGERAVHERGKLGGHGGVVETARREIAGREALDEHVGGRRELEEPVAIGGVVEVEHDAALPAVRDDRSDVRPLGITAGWLDLHDIGAVIAERHGRERSREPSGQVDDPQSFQCAWHAESPFSGIGWSRVVDHARLGGVLTPRGADGGDAVVVDAPVRGPARRSGRGLRLALAVRRHLRRNEFSETLDGGTHRVDLLVQKVQPVRRLAAA